MTYPQDITPAVAVRYIEAPGVLYCSNVRCLAERPVFRRLPPLKPGARIGELPSYGGWERPAALPKAA